MNNINLIDDIKKFYKIQDINIIENEFNNNDNNYLFGLDYDILLVNGIENNIIQNWGFANNIANQQHYSILKNIPLIPMPKKITTIKKKKLVQIKSKNTL